MIFGQQIRAKSPHERKSGAISLAYAPETPTVLTSRFDVEESVVGHHRGISGGYEGNDSPEYERASPVSRTHSDSEGACREKHRSENTPELHQALHDVGLD
jgi:hypothetical protein